MKTLAMFSDETLVAMHRDITSVLSDIAADTSVYEVWKKDLAFLGLLRKELDQEITETRGITA